MPQLLDNQMEVFVDHEKLLSNKPELLLASKYHQLPRIQESTDREIVQITMKTDLN